MKIGSYRVAEVRKALVALAAFLTTVVAVVLEATLGLYSDGIVSTGEWLAIAVLAINAIATFKVPNEDSDPTPHDEVGEEIDDPLDADHELGPLDDHGDTPGSVRL